MDRIPQERRRPAWRLVWLSFAVAVFVAVAASIALLPAGLASVLAWQASEALDVPVEIERVDFAPWRGRVALTGVVVFPPPSARREPKGEPTPSEPASLATDGESRKSVAPWLSVRRLALEIDWAALLSGRLHLRELRLEHPQLRLVRFADGDVNLSRLTPGREIPSPEDDSDVADPDVADDEMALTVDRFAVRDGALYFRDFSVRAPGPIEVQLDAVTVRHFVLSPGANDAPARAVVEAAIGDAALTAAFEFAAREAGVELDGQLHLEDLSLRHARAYLRGVGWHGLEGEADLHLQVRSALGERDSGSFLAVVRNARLDGGAEGGEAEAERVSLDLELEAAQLAELAEEPNEAEPLRLGGRLFGKSVSFQEADGEGFEASAASIEIDVENAGWQSAEEPGSDAFVVELGQVDVREPSVHLVFGEAGIAAPRAGERVAEGLRPETADATPALRVRSARIADGRLQFTDRTLEPFGVVELSRLQLEADDLAWPERTAKHLSLEAATIGGGTLRVEGDLALPAVTAELAASRVSLPPFNPYAEALTGYSVRDGTASLRSRLTSDDARYLADTQLVLHDLALQGERGRHLFRQRFGVPLALGLALLRDVRGDVTLDIPIELEAGVGVRVGLTTTLSSSLRRAFVNALATPLKLIGSVVVTDGEVERFEPAPLEAETGRADLLPASHEHLEALAQVLAERPDLEVILTGSVTSADGHWLAARARDPDRLEKQAPLVERLEDLARERVFAACRWLREKRGVPSTRIRVAWDAEPSTPALEGVDVALGVARDGRGSGVRCSEDSPQLAAQ